MYRGLYRNLAVRTICGLPPPLEIIVFTYPVMMGAKLRLIYWLIDCLGLILATTGPYELYCLYAWVGLDWFQLFIYLYRTGGVVLWYIIFNQDSIKRNTNSKFWTNFYVYKDFQLLLFLKVNIQHIFSNILEAKPFSNDLVNLLKTFWWIIIYCVSSLLLKSQLITVINELVSSSPRDFLQHLVYINERLVNLKLGF